MYFNEGARFSDRAGLAISVTFIVSGLRARPRSSWLAGEAKREPTLGGCGIRSPGGRVEGVVVKQHPEQFSGPRLLR
jgi:hypothetical protein